jgi:HK97 family phage portal protein
MGLASSLVRMLTPAAVKAAEGAYRPGPYHLPVTGGWLSAEAGQYWNYWQKGYDVQPYSTRSAIVEACVSAYSQTVAMCPGDHWRSTKKGGRERVTTSALSRILRRPNDYQSISDFMLNAVRHLYLDGNAYALCLRNERYEISEMHLMDPRQSKPEISDGEIYYRLGGNNIIQERLGEEFEPRYPQRDVLHIRLHAQLHQSYPLLGESPIWAAAGNIAAGDAMKQHQLAFFRNEARPSFILTTDLTMDKPSLDYLRDRWNEQTRGAGAGGTPILTSGLKPVPVQIASRDAQVAEIMKMNSQDIALAYRVPLPLLGLSTSSKSSTEALMQEWIASGLGFCLNHVEEAIGLTFRLFGQPDDYVEFSTAALLRSAFKDRIEGLTRAVQGGIFSPNDARNQEGFDSVEYGDEPRVQQQVVPLSAAASIPAPGATGPKPPPAPGPDAPPSGEAPKLSEDKPADDKPPPSKESYYDGIDTIVRSLYSAADEHERIA